MTALGTSVYVWEPEKNGHAFWTWNFSIFVDSVPSSTITCNALKYSVWTLDQKRGWKNVNWVNRYNWGHGITICYGREEHEVNTPLTAAHTYILPGEAEDNGGGGGH